MAWYRAGTVAVTNGSTTVTGTGTAFVGNVEAGESFVGPDGRPYEIESVNSATQLTLGQTYQSANASGQAYAILPTQSYLYDLATNAAELIASFAAVRDGIGQGLIPDGTVAAPGLRFANDQDTGFYRPSANAFGFVTAGVERFRVDATGNVGIGTASPSAKVHVAAAGSGSTTTLLILDNPGSGDGTTASINLRAAGQTYGQIAGGFRGVGGLFFEVLGVERARLTSGGNLLVGTTSGAAHTLKRDVGQGSELVAIFSNQPTPSARFFGGASFGASAAETVLTLASNSATGRSLNAGGTINTSGADYAEYMTKAEGCGPIAKGDICGVDRDGKLTKTWAEAVRFVVKSSDPNLVGGDSWGQSVGTKPTPPVPLAPEPIAPHPPAEFTAQEPVREEEESESDFAVRHYQWEQVKATADDALVEYQAILSTLPARHAQWVQASTAHDAATSAFEAALTDWEAAFEAARAKVDRIAFCGQVPVNVEPTVLADCVNALDDGEAVYLVAVANGGEIGCTAIRESAMTLPDYMRRLGAVWRIENGRPIIDVQHG